MAQLTLSQALGRAAELGRNGQAEAAAALLSRVLAAAPDQPDALQLLGMVERSRGLNDEAVRLFHASLRINPHQPNVLNNLGNALLDLGRCQEAVQSYRKALALAPSYPDALLNLALAQLALSEWAEAEGAARECLRHQPRNAKALVALGRAHREQGQLGASAAALEEALSHKPGDAAALHSLALSHRAAGRIDEAIGLLAEILAQDPEVADSQYVLGHCYQDLGRMDDAADAYEAAVRIRPADRSFHQSLNSLYWKVGKLGRFLLSYRQSLALFPDDAGLRADLARWLVLSGRAEEAVDLIVEAMGRELDGAELRHRLGQALWSSARPQEALAEFRRALAMAPSDESIARETARSLIVLHDYGAAEAILDPLVVANPHDQQALAYLGACWRLTSDPREAWLNDHESFVESQLLDPPPGEGSREAFNRKLADVLEGLHRGAQHPLDQTLRGGTQTLGDLFDRQEREIAIVRRMIEAAVAGYIERLPDDPDHPFLRRRSKAFRFSGSWSVRLRTGGFHENHIHPEGWISSSYYVALPSAVHREGSRAGWLKLGESGLRLGERERKPLLIRPSVGTLVLFPSYIYHGTVPFDDPEVRTTIAFDIVPA